jgi:hypothetical protein
MHRRAHRVEVVSGIVGESSCYVSRSRGIGRVMKNTPVCSKCGAPRGMDAFELRADIAHRLAHWRGTSRRENERFHRDLKRLAGLAQMSVEALLTELHQDAELIDE